MRSAGSCILMHAGDHTTFEPVLYHPLSRYGFSAPRRLLRGFPSPQVAPRVLHTALKESDARREVRKALCRLWPSKLSNSPLATAILMASSTSCSISSRSPSAGVSAAKAAGGPHALNKAVVRVAIICGRPGFSTEPK